MQTFSEHAWKRLSLSVILSALEHPAIRANCNGKSSELNTYRYWDFARAVRILPEAYFDQSFYDHECAGLGSVAPDHEDESDHIEDDTVYEDDTGDEDDTVPENDLDEDAEDAEDAYESGMYESDFEEPCGCFHKLSVSMLGWLQTQAWSEIHGNVILTIGTILPAELAEKVFEQTLVAEGIPTSPSVRERIVVLDTTPDRKHKHHYWANDGKPRPLSQVKALYKCGMTGRW